MSKRRAEQEQIDLVVGNLVERKRVHGQVSNALVARAAERLGVSKATVRRWMAAGSAKRAERKAFTVSEADLELYFECRGNVAEVWRRKQRAGDELPSRRQLARAFAKALDRAERAYAREGEEGYRRHSLYLRLEQDHRNQLWQADHCKLPIWVSVPRRTDWFQPWVTLFLDCASRAIPGYAISLQPTAAEVLAAVRAAIVIDPDRGPFGGVPEMILWDNGAEFLSDHVTNALTDVGCYVAATRPHSPHEKGKVERVFRTIADEFLRSQPFYIDGPRAADGKLFGPKDAALPIEEFVARFEEWVRHYNHERVHSAHGMTPAQAWEQDPHPLHVIDGEQLRWMLLARETRMVRKDGVLWGGKPFFATELHGLVGDEVEIRFMPYDYRQIWVYRDGSFLCKALPHAEVSEEARRAHLGNRVASKKRAQQLRRTTTRKQRAGRIQAMTSPGEVIDTVAPVTASPDYGRKEPVTGKVLDLLGLDDLNSVVED